MMSHWLYNGIEFTDIPDGAFGFIYRITNNKTGKKYIGRKYFYSTRRVKVKGKKRRKVIVSESKWRSYVGSSKVLVESIEMYGADNFRYEVLAIGYTKGQVNFLEENIQHKLDVLTDTSYYNDSIGSGKFISVKNDENFRNVIATISL